MSTVRVLTIKTDPYNQKALKDAQMVLQIAKTVLSKGKLVSNVVWKTSNIQPNFDSSWTPTYGINWTSTVPAQGMKVVASGNWQPIETGQSFDLDDGGNFVPSIQPGDPDYINIGENRCSTDNPLGVYIILGVQKVSPVTLQEVWQPIFVDEVPLGPGQHGKWQPQESISWWYSANLDSGVMKEQHGARTETADFSAPDPATRSFHKTSTFDWTTGLWTTSVVVD